MSPHQDPLNRHQFAIPTVLLSSFGKDFKTGGFYVLDEDQTKIYLDQRLEFGDLTLFHTSITQEVELVDKELSLDKSSSSGRLMMIAAVNSTSNQKEYQSSRDV